MELRRRIGAQARLPGDGGCAVDDSGSGRTARASVGSKNDVGVEQGDQRVEVAAAGCQEKGVDHRALTSDVRVRCGDFCPVDAPPCPAGQLPGRGRGSTHHSPALNVPGVLDALQSLGAAARDAAKQAGLPHTTMELVNLRASQINGCAVCLDMHSRGAKKAGETDERLSTLAAWRDAPYFTDAERAALALTEAGTRLADRAEGLPDAVFDEAAQHYDEPALAALVVCIAAINTWNRLNVITGQVAGEWTAQWAS
jgi:AhpD family alkylhydroperoxidase